MDLEKAYDRADREALWSGTGGRLMRVVNSFHKGSRACVGI